MKKNVVVLATRNAHKVREIRQLLRGFALRSLSEMPPTPDVIENGKTLQVNAIKKAECIAAKLQCLCLADDSGLFVPSLKGQPGVRSARYAGLGKDYKANNTKLLARMKGLQGSKRKAYFATAVAAAGPKLKTKVIVGKLWGKIIFEPRGDQGFGYDPLFQPEGKKKTLAEMSLTQKNRLSHRAIAFHKMADWLKRKTLAKIGRKS
jgi:non-canonical purine NTP pyrophosphatase (RdgB/HAM1 family)